VKSQFLIYLIVEPVAMKDNLDELRAVLAAHSGEPRPIYERRP